MKIISKLKSMTPAARKAERAARERKFTEEFYEDLIAFKSKGRMTANTDKKSGTTTYSIANGDTRLILTHVTLGDRYSLRIKNNRGAFRNIDKEFTDRGSLAHIAFDFVGNKINLKHDDIYVLRNVLTAIKSSNKGIVYNTGILGFIDNNKDYFLYRLGDKKFEVSAFHTAPSFLPYASGRSNETYELSIKSMNKEPKNYRAYNTVFSEYVFNMMARLYAAQQRRNGR